MCWDWFGPSNGVPYTAFCVGFRSGAVQTHDGHLWFATYSGALEVVPEGQGNKLPAAPVVIEGIEVSGAILPPLSTKGFIVKPNPGPIQINYALPKLSDCEQLRFRYRLVGLGDDDWVAAGGERKATFVHLSPGAYRFEVQGREGDGPWLPSIASVAFTVRAAWWQTFWFRLAFVLAVLLGSGWLVREMERRRLRRRMRELEQQHALANERARIARDIHDELGSSLTQIGIQSKLAQIGTPEATRQHVDNIAGIAQRTAVMFDEIVWAVNPRNDTLASFLEYLGDHAHNFLRGAGIRCELEFPNDVPMLALEAATRHHAFMAIKEALNNVVKHARASEVRLAAKLDGGKLLVKITDNGCGFELGRETVGADGLRNMKNRMAELGGDCRIESRLGEGTCTSFELPID
jgi:signal transduction histidine kinase